MKKVLITINVDNTIDLITNSSSELFVLKNTVKQNVVEMLEFMYPNFRDEYEDPKNINELTVEELDQYINQHCSNYNGGSEINNYPLIRGFTFDELYAEKKAKDWRGRVEYELKNNKVSTWQYDTSFVTEDNFEEVKHRIDPESNLFFLYSKDENPNWEEQEKLMGVGDRYHLG